MDERIEKICRELCRLDGVDPDKMMAQNPAWQNYQEIVVKAQASRLAKVEDRAAKLEGMLSECASTFEYYAVNHQLKADTATQRKDSVAAADAMAKADVNLKLAARIRKMLER